MSESKNRPLLRDFTSYCIDHPEQRFWQALYNWMRKDGEAYGILIQQSDGNNDPFNWEGKNG